MTPMDEEQQYQREQYHDRLLASAVQFLIDGGEEKAATILLSCTLDYDGTGYIITVTAPRASYYFLAPLNNRNFHSLEFRANCSLEYQENVLAICDDIVYAFSALLGEHVEIAARASLVPITEQWRHELLALLRGDHVTNQGLPVAQAPDGAMLLHHLAQQHPTELQPYLDRMRTEVAAEAYLVVARHKPRHNFVYLSADLSRPYRSTVTPQICTRGLSPGGSLVLALWGVVADSAGLA